MADEFEDYDAETLRGICRMYQKQNIELLQENTRLFNGYNAAMTEIAILKAPRKIGRPLKDQTYEDYLYREANELICIAMRKGKKLSKRNAAIEANALIRKTAGILQQNNTSGSFKGLIAYRPAVEDAVTEEAIYNAYNRAQRRLRST